jgi:hypothetical protein
LTRRWGDGKAGAASGAPTGKGDGKGKDERYGKGDGKCRSLTSFGMTAEEKWDDSRRKTRGQRRKDARTATEKREDNFGRRKSQKPHAQVRRMGHPALGPAFDDLGLRG